MFICVLIFQIISISQASSTFNEELTLSQLEYSALAKASIYYSAHFLTIYSDICNCVDRENLQRFPRVTCKMCKTAKFSHPLQNIKGISCKTM